MLLRGDEVLARAGDGRRYLLYSITKTYLAVTLLQLGVSIEDPVRAWFDDPRLPAATLRQVLNHTSGLPDYTRLEEYRALELGHEAWPDEELLDRALALGQDFAPGEGWAYSNTGYLLLRMVVERVAGFERALSEEVLEPLGLRETQLALEPVEVHGRSYDPRWVGHRTLVAPADEVGRFWLAVARSELVPVQQLTESVTIGAPAPGFARPSYGLGVMHDPASRLGELIGHGGGGPGFSTAAFAVLGDEPVVAVVLSDEDIDAQDRALSLLGSGVRDRR